MEERDKEDPQATASRPLTHPLEDLLDDNPLADTGSEGQQDDDLSSQDKPVSLKSAESLDTILLEASPMIESVDLGSDSVIMDQSAMTSSSQISEDASKLGDTEMEGVEADLQGLTVTDTDPLQHEEGQLAGGEKCFVLDEDKDKEEVRDEDDNEASQFFDALEAEPPETDDKKDVGKRERPPGVKIVLPSSPVPSSEEPTPIAFEEEKGSGILRPTPSTKSLSKFFTDDTGGTDVEGKSFFDSFTAETGEDPVLPSSPSVSRQNSTTNGGSASLPPTSPAISSPLPTQQSPVPSPLHQPSSRPPSEEITLKTLAHSVSQEDDPFSASLHMSDLDRRYDAWIPCEPTRQALISMVTSPAGTFFPDPDHLTKPCVLIAESQGDPIRDLVQRFMGEVEANKRATQSADSVSQDENGLRQLIASEWWRAAVDLTNRLLSQCGQSTDRDSRPKQCKHTTYTLQLWFTRLALFMKLKMYSHAESELQAFGNLDRPDLYYEFYPDAYPGRKGSMVPFDLRLLHAELPQYLGKSQESLDLLYYLQAIVTKVVSNLESGLAEDGSMIQLSNDSRKGSRELWEARESQLLYSIANCLLSIKDYATAIEIMETLLKKEENKKDLIMCAIGRIYLQMGDVTCAQNYFDQVEKISDSNISHVHCRNLINKGLLALGQNQFQDAHQFFKQAVAVEPDNAVGINNMAVCSLYMGQLKEALATLETLVHRDPAHFLQEGVLFNLCTLYELESSHAMHKKQTLLDLVSKHKGNGFNAACLKMT